MRQFMLAFLAIGTLLVTSCAGKTGSKDFDHNVAIVATTAGPTYTSGLTTYDSILLTLQNNTGYDAVFAHQYTLNSNNSGILCWNGSTSFVPFDSCTGSQPDLNPHTQGVWIQNTEQILLPQYAQKDVILNACHGYFYDNCYTSNEVYPGPCPDLSGITLYCTVSPFSQGSGWFETTYQTISY